jgi:hypothetical protein
MTTAQPRAKWSWTPSFTEHWLEAMLRAFAMFVVQVAATFRMSFSRYARVCDTQPAPVVLPEETRDISNKETHAAAPDSQTIEALMVSSERSSRLSNHEGELTGGCSLEWTIGPCPRRRPGPSNHLASCSDLGLPPRGRTSLLVSTGPRPSPGTRLLALVRKAPA